MRIYQPSGVVDEPSRLAGTIGLIFKIESAQIVSAEGKEKLSLQLREQCKDGQVYNHEFLGDHVQEDFMIHMGVNQANELIGKGVFGFVAPKKPTIAGIAPREKTRRIY